MLNRIDAQRLASEYVAALPVELSDDDKLVVLDEHTIERAWGWVFFYTSRLWNETGDFKYALAGNAPLLLERETGRLLVLGTALPVENYIAAYEQSGDPHAKVKA